ncbi:MAG: VCBS repeat-containing protein, partial [Blastocatellia bacterium]
MKLLVSFLTLRHRLLQSAGMKIALLSLATVLFIMLLLFQPTSADRTAGSDDRVEHIWKERLVSSGQITLRERTGLPLGCCEEDRRIFEPNSAKPMSLTVGDFDGDGVPDVVGGYGYEDRGLLILYTGLSFSKAGIGVGSSPTSPAGMRVFEDGLAPDFLGVGDFDADGHLDLVVATRGGNE